jgi:hypothetical protein
MCCDVVILCEENVSLIRKTTPAESYHYYEVEGYGIMD